MIFRRQTSNSRAQSDRIRLLKFLGIFEIGGTERHVVALARGMDYSKFALHFGCFRRTGQFLDEVERLGIPISEYTIPSLYSPQTPLRQLRLARMLRQRGIQIVHTYGFYPAVFAVPAARLARVPLVVASIRDTGELLSPLQKYIQKLVCRWADSILVNADAVRNWLVDNGYKADKIEVIRNGIDLRRFAKVRGASEVRRELGIEPHVPLVAVLGRINRLKGMEYFLTAAGAVAARFPQARFLIVGDCRAVDSDYKQELKRQAIKAGLGGRLLFTGFRLDIPQILSEISISVLPSLSEGLSNVLLESMAAGVPVIATRVGGNPEIVDEGTGILVPPGDADALARAMALLIEQPELARRFGEAGRHRVFEHFNLEKMVRRTEQHYIKLMERTGRRADRPGKEAAA